MLLLFCGKILISDSKQNSREFENFLNGGELLKYLSSVGLSYIVKAFTVDFIKLEIILSQIKSLKQKLLGCSRK